MTSHFLAREAFTRCHINWRTQHRTSVMRGVKLFTSRRSVHQSVEDHSSLSIEALKGKHYLYRDFLNSNPIHMLRNTLEGHLPFPLESDLINGNREWLHLGYQHLFFRPSLTPAMLCRDGTDTKFLPGPEDIWKYRLWAGGSVRHTQDRPIEANFGPVHLLEFATDVRVVGQDGIPDKVFVTINRIVSTGFENLTLEQMIVKMPEHIRDKNNKIAVGLVETENICFLRQPPSSFRDSRKVKPPSNATFTHTMIPTRSLLFQFSAFTFNAHNIHLDRESARREYGAKDLVVHGPLTLVLMSEFLRTTLQRAAKLDSQTSTTHFVPMQINYTNLQPLYVDEPLTLCCKPASATDETDLTEIKEWQVWIQTGSGDEASCAVKARMTIATQPSLSGNIKTVVP